MTNPDQRHMSVDDVPAQANHSITGRQLLLSLALIVVLSGGGAVATFLIVGTVDATWRTTVDFVVLLVAEVYLLAIAALLIAVGGPVGVRDRLAFRYTGAGDLLVTLGTWVLTVVLGTLLYLVLSPAIGPLSNTLLEIQRLNTDMSRLSGADALALGLIAMRAGVIAPLAEELVFRGALFGWVRQRLSAPLTIVLTSALFTALQIAATRSLIPAPWVLVASTAVTWIRSRTGSSLNSFVMHAVNNSVMLISASVVVAWHIAR